METMDGVKDRVNFFHSITFKIMLVVILSSMLCILANVVNAEYSAEKAIRGLNDEYLLSVASNLSESISSIPRGQMTNETYTEMVSSVKMEGIESSYSYLLDVNGKMLYHPNTEKIGQQSEVQEVRDVVGQIKAGTAQDRGILSYVREGVKKRGLCKDRPGHDRCDND